MIKKPYVVHCAIVRDTDDNVHFGYATNKRGAQDFYKRFEAHLVLDFNAYGGGILDQMYIMLHCDLATDNLSQEDREDILATTAFYIMQTILIAPDIYEDKNCNFEGLTIIKA